MHPQACKEHLCQRFDRLWNQGGLSAADTLCRKQVVLHFPAWQHLIGVQGQDYKNGATFARNLFPNLHVHIREMVIEGDHSSASCRPGWPRRPRARRGLFRGLGRRDRLGSGRSLSQYCRMARTPKGGHQGDHQQGKDRCDEDAALQADLLGILARK